MVGPATAAASSTGGVSCCDSCAACRAGPWATTCSSQLMGCAGESVEGLCPATAVPLSVTAGTASCTATSKCEEPQTEPHECSLIPARCTVPSLEEKDRDNASHPIGHSADSWSCCLPQDAVPASGGAARRSADAARHFRKQVVQRGISAQGPVFPPWCSPEPRDRCCQARQ